MIFAMVENNVNVDKFEKAKLWNICYLKECLAKRFMMICLPHRATMSLHTA